MQVTYRITPIPLDSSSPEQQPLRFDVRLVTVLEFSEGTVTGGDVVNALAAHPVFGRPADQPVDAVAVPLAEWIASGKPAAVSKGIAVSLKYAGAKPLMALRDVLGSYLERPADVAVSPVQHDSRFDKLHAQDFVDLNRLHDDLWLLRTHIYASVTERLAFTTSIPAGPSSFEKARWVNSYVQSTALELVFGDSKGVTLFANSPVGAAAARLKDGVKKVQDRLASSDAVRAFVASDGLRRASDKGDVSVSVSDPNVAVHAALKNALLSESCGITTSWHAVAAQPVTGDHVLFLQGASFAQKSYPLVLHSTAFRRMGHTHPLSFVDMPQPGKQARTTNSALACLNDEQGNPRYRATAINAEVAIIQGTVLQFNNSLSNTAQPAPQQQGGDFTDVLDQRPPQLLVDEHRGVNEPECTGLTISAPTADLLAPDALKDAQREAVWPCLFLEDLWTGFRLDLADSVEPRFSSVHQQVQEITLTGSSRKIKGPVEDAYEREQTPDSPSARSTEIIRYVGMSSGQARDYLRLLGTDKRIAPHADAPFQISVTGYSGATALRFGRLYCYRLRNVLMGGISLSAADADGLGPTNSYVQCCPFFRARAYRAGELVSANFSNSNDASRSIFLTRDAPDASVWVVPSPIDMDTARYHGIFLSQKSEPARYAHREFVQDVSHYFRRRPSDLRYFFDPDVAAISVQVTVLNGDPDSTSHEFTYERDTYCELTPHMYLSPVRVEYGRAGKWEEFRPIELRFSISSGSSVEVTKQGRTVCIVAPVSAELEITILPELGKDQLHQTASYAASSAQMKLRATPGLADAASIVPAVAEQKLQVTHCAKAPTLRPFFGGVPVRFSPTGETVTVAERSRLKETADLPGYIQVDAASAGQVWLEAVWSDIEDRPWQDRPALTSAHAISTPRSVLFDRHLPPSASLMARVAMSNASLFMQSVDVVQSSFGLQCAENKIFLLNPPQSQSQSQQPSSQPGRPCTLNFVDGRRKRATVTAVTSSRYKAQFKPGPASAFQIRSEQILVDVPASMMLPAPDISHVVPISHDLVQPGGGTRRTQRIYAMRIYVRPPWLVSGPGERLAVGCRLGAAADGPVSSLDTFVTQWGEDPIERPHLDVTRDPPRMTDFQVPENGNTEPLDATFYPQRSIEGANEVLYLDNLSVADAALVKRTISVASFALRRDPTTKLWFCDVRVAGGFLGWCGLALYRHQPHSHEDLQLSATPAWVYGAILHGEQIVWVRGGGMLHVTVGPVFDPNASFELDRTSYYNNVTRDLTRAAGTRVTLQPYKSGRATYFEGIVKMGDGPWSLIKRRFGSEVASISLHTGG